MKLFWSLMTSFAGFGLANYVNFRERPTCSDCGFPYGWPFYMYNLGGFDHIHVILWRGIAANVLLAVMAAMILWLAIRRDSREAK